jgi:signal peptidase II
MRPSPKTLPAFFVVLGGTAGCDHASKQLALSSLADAGSVSLAGDTLRLQLASNTGGFLSLGAGLPDGLREILFIGLVPLLLLALCAYYLRSADASIPLRVALGLVAGGGLANWVDRMLHDGAVTDFINLGVGPLRTGIFNVADVAVVAGAGLLIWSTQSTGEPTEEQTA